MRDKICRIAMGVCALAFLAVMLLDPVYSENEQMHRLIKSVVFHLLGTLVFVALLCFLRYRVLHLPSLRVWLTVVLPCLLVVVNNLPILALAWGEAQINRPELLPIFLLDCMLIGAFEELAFRATFFLTALERHRATSRQIFLTSAVSSAVFGLIHMINLFEGAGIGATVMQVGYSFLIGGMCSIVLLKTGNILICVLLHGIFDVGGGFLSVLGSGNQWNMPTVVITAVLAVVVTVWMILVLLRVSPEETARLYSLAKKSRNR